MDERDELSRRREARSDHLDLDARLREELLEGQREPTLAALQRRVESATRARRSASNVVALLRRRAADGDAAAAERLPAAVDRATAAGDRLIAALDRRGAAEVLQRSFRDELTGALQRAAGQQQLGRELERLRRVRTPMVLAFVDVDGLKRVNDEQGHLAGDAVLQAVGQSLASHVRSYDVLFRFGGDEFVVALLGVGLDEAQARFRRIAEGLDRRSPGTTVSVGYAIAAADDGVMDLMRRADDDLYLRRRSARTPCTLVDLTAAERSEPPRG